MANGRLPEVSQCREYIAQKDNQEGRYPEVHPEARSGSAGEACWTTTRREGEAQESYFARADQARPGFIPAQEQEARMREGNRASIIGLFSGVASFLGREKAGTAVPHLMKTMTPAAEPEIPTIAFEDLPDAPPEDRPVAEEPSVRREGTRAAGPVKQESDEDGPFEELQPGDPRVQVIEGDVVLAPEELPDAPNAG